MLGKHCCDCGKELEPQYPDIRCLNCLGKAREKYGAIPGDFYTASEVALILGDKSEEQVRRLARKGKIPGRIPIIRRVLFDKKTIDELMAKSRFVSGVAATPLQEEAQAMCRAENHQWLGDEKYEDSYRSEVTNIKHTSLITIFYRRKCYFCGHTELVPI